MYKEEILELYRNPHNFGRIVKPNKSVTLHNPLCGDVVTMDVVVAKGKVHSVSFSGESCVICRVSSSKLTDYAKNKKEEELIKLDRSFMINLIGIEVSPARLKCLLLPLEVLRKALSG